MIDERIQIARNEFGDKGAELVVAGMMSERAVDRWTIEKCSRARLL